MRRLATKIKPASGFSQFIYWLLVVIIPLLIFVLIRLSFVPLAYSVVLLSKWRMLAVRPRHWPANIRANAVDIMVGLSFVTFTARAPSQAWQLVWLGLYAVWLIFIKPRSSTFWNTVQAGTAQLLSLIALYLIWGRSSLLIIVLLTWGICYLSARHFFSSFDEPLTSLLSHFWGYLGAALTWILGHWLLYYGLLSQPALFIAVLAYGLAALYYLETNDRLSSLVRREIILIMSAVILVVILVSDWSDKTI